MNVTSYIQMWHFEGFEPPFCTHRKYAHDLPPPPISEEMSHNVSQKCLMASPVSGMVVLLLPANAGLLLGFLHFPGGNLLLPFAVPSGH